MSFIEQAQLKYLHYRHKVSPVLFLLSFILDLWLIEKPDSIETIVFISIHFSLTIILLLMTVRAADIDMNQLKSHKWSTTLKIFLEILLQFTFGALASALFVLYFKGSDIVSSLPFLFLLAAFLIGNEFAHKHTSRLEVRFASTIFLSYSFLIYLIPLFRGKLGNISLLISTLIAIFLSIILLFLIRRIGSTLFQHTKKILISSVAVLFVGLPLLVLFDVIPPLPLLLREGSVVHNIEKVYNVEYNVEIEPQPLYLRLGLPFLRPTYHLESGGGLTFFTAIYTPSEIEAGIIHTWEWYNNATGKYEEKSRIPLYVTGGRQNGFRTYSTMSGIYPGRWRVSAELATGQVLGHREFIVANGLPNLVGAVK